MDPCGGEYECTCTKQPMMNTHHSKMSTFKINYLKLLTWTSYLRRLFIQTGTIKQLKVEPEGATQLVYIPEHHKWWFQQIGYYYP